MADRFLVEDTPLSGLKVITRTTIGDPRGFLSRFYCADEFRALGLVTPIMQINQTMTNTPGSIRGMHFQYPPHAEDKFVSVLSGEVLDVAVDLRRGSPTFRQWHAVRLSSENRRSLLIPKGFAHGFQTLQPACELIYLHTHNYEASAEGALNPLDPALGIEWPLPVSDMSARDRAHPMLTPEFMGI